MTPLAIFSLWKNHIKISPYPDGKSFAFTIIDDTDGSTMEMIRPIYDYLASIGIKTTKTVWVNKPKEITSDSRDQGDTLERKDYIVYLKSLQEKGFEIALHNVSSRSNVREDIISGIEKFKNIFGYYPKINVHHEKNKENLHFDIAQSWDYVPSPFHSNFFKKTHTIYKKVKRFIFPKDNLKLPRKDEFFGEKSESDYFWGDICKSKIKYVRSDIFFPDLNTLKCNPTIPYSLSETPYINYWFDSSNGKDVKNFNTILNRENIQRLQKERGCCILFTHFGKGFSVMTNGHFELNVETKQKLEEIARNPDGWFVPVSIILDRLLAFKNLRCYQFSEGIILINDNPYNITNLTLWVTPFKGYFDIYGQVFKADKKGRIVIPLIGGQKSFILLKKNPLKDILFWYNQEIYQWLLDIKRASLIIMKKLYRH